jgi:hypothetical protein
MPESYEKETIRRKTQLHEIIDISAPINVDLFCENLLTVIKSFLPKNTTGAGCTWFGSLGQPDTNRNNPSCVVSHIKPRQLQP